MAPRIHKYFASLGVNTPAPRANRVPPSWTATHTGQATRPREITSQVGKDDSCTRRSLCEASRFCAASGVAHPSENPNTNLCSPFGHALILAADVNRESSHPNNLRSLPSASYRGDSVPFCQRASTMYWLCKLCRLARIAAARHGGICLTKSDHDSYSKVVRLKRLERCPRPVRALCLATLGTTKRRGAAGFSASPSHLVLGSSSSRQFHRHPWQAWNFATVYPSTALN